MGSFSQEDDIFMFYIGSAYALLPSLSKSFWPCRDGIEMFKLPWSVSLVHWCCGIGLWDRAAA
jgi:hypothetical protein